MSEERVEQIIESETIKDDSVRYSKSEVINGTYKYTRFTPQEGGTGQTIDTGGGQQHTVFIGPSYCLNWARSNMIFQVCVTGAPINNNWTYADVPAFIREISLQPDSGNAIVNMQSLPYFYKISSRYLTSFESYENNDSNRPLYPSNNPVSTNKQSIAAIAPSTSNNAIVNWIGPQLCYQSNTNNATASPANAILNWIIPCSFFKGTELGVNRSIYYGQNVKLIITYEGMQKWLWNGTSTTDPSAGIGNTGSTSANIQLLLDLAIEQNPEIIAQLRNRVNTEGMEVIVPFVTRIYNTPLNGSNQPVSVVVNRSHGFRLKRMWWAVFNSTTTNNTVLDCANYNQAKIQYYQTYWDGTAIQPSPLYSGGVPSASQRNFDDYEYLAWRMKGSVVLNMLDYMYNHFHVDDFAQPIQTFAAAGSLPDVNKVEGVSLEDGVDHQYIVQAVTPSQLNIHYAWAECEKVMTITPGFIKVA